ncbi:MAG: RNA polymerase sigma factor [Lachnospiraceae bacterium]|nr:RNA polymerase sigma factor [Lachnospiraceae bacterium]
MLIYLTLIDNEDEKQKFERLYSNYRSKMQYIAVGILKDEHEAENIVHDTFITMIDVLDKIDETDDRKAWNYIVTILKNKCYNYLKRRNRMVYSDDILNLDDSETEDILQTVIREESIFVIAELIRKLNYPYKEVLYLQYYNGMNSKKIAELLQLTPSNVRQISNRAKKRIKELLKEMGYDDGDN